MYVAYTCELSVFGGGCPDLAECRETCSPCYVGIGVVRYYCKPGGPILIDQCVCVMDKGAPCNVRGCPRPWHPPSTSNHTQTQFKSFNLTT